MFGHDQKNHSATRSAENADCLAVGDHWVLTGPLLKFELVCAAARPATVEACYRKKQARYARFGAVAASVPLHKTEPKCLHVLIATDCDSHDIVGSVSIYRRGEGSALPMENAVRDLPRVQPEIARWEGRHIVELSGLWVDELWRKTGLSEQLMLAAFAASHQLGADKIVGFSHQHVLAFYGSVGLKPDYDLGQYRYPDENYLSTVVWGDPTGLVTLPAEKRPMVRRYADCIAFGHHILWRNFNERFAFNR